MTFHFQLNTNMISFSIYFSQLRAHMLQTDNGMPFGNGVERHSIFRISLSLLACLSQISDLAFGFYRSSVATYLNQVWNARSRSFSTRFRDHGVISACMHQQGDRVEGSRGVAPATHVFVKGTCLLARRLGRVSCSNGVGWDGALVVHFIIEISAELIARHDYSIVINVRTFLKRIYISHLISYLSKTFNFHWHNIYEFKEKKLLSLIFLRTVNFGK